jgi:hypothetical protein
VFDWDEGNLDHIGEPGLLPEEVEEALLDQWRMPATAYQIPGESRRAALGATPLGACSLSSSLAVARSFGW